MNLTGMNISLRPLLKSDLAMMVEWNNDVELQKYVDCDLPPNLTELECWYAKNVPDRHYQIYVLQFTTGEVIGDLELDHICWNKREAELRIRIGQKKYWGKGLGSEALRLILDYFMGERAFNRIYLRVYDFNQRAICCYLKSGFRQIGVLRRCKLGWKDIVLMEITQTSYQHYCRRKANSLMVG